MLDDPILVLIAAAQDLPNSFTSTENSPVKDSENDVSSIFEDEEIVEYTTFKPSVETINNGMGNSEELVIISKEESTASSQSDYDDWEIVNNNETLFEEFNQMTLNPTFKPSDETIDNGMGSSEEFVIISNKESTASSQSATTEKSNEASNNGIGTTEKLPTPPPNDKLDFDDWDTVHDNETLFEEFNQTILNQMRAGKFQPEHITATLETSTSKQPRYTVGGATRNGFWRCTNVRKHVYTEPAKKKIRQCGRTLQTCTERSKKNTMPTFIVEMEDMIDVAETPSSTTSKPRFAPPIFTWSMDYDMVETDKPQTVPTPPNTAGTTSGFESDEDDSGEYLDGIKPVPVTDYDTDKARNDPCNYERYEHPLPPIEKTGRRVSDIKCEEYLWNYQINVLDVEKNRKLCKENMEQNQIIPSEIFGGIKAEQGDFPHMGAVGWIRNDGQRKYMCGSSLISPRFSLTAAHCRNASTSVMREQNLKYSDPKVVRFGSVYLEDIAIKMNRLIVEDVLIDEFLVLEEYAKNPVKKYNDIGLIKLQTEVQFKLFIRPACLWHGYVGESWSANVTGWGKTTNAIGSESNHLRYAELDFVEQATCKKYIHGRRNRHWSEGLKDHQFCAGKLRGGIDACQGDSGGPLGVLAPVPAALNTSDVSHRIIGVTSFGIKCGYPMLPGVYVNVTSFMCWIEKNVWPEETNDFCS